MEPQDRIDAVVTLHRDHQLGPARRSGLRDARRVREAQLLVDHETDVREVEREACLQPTPLERGREAAELLGRLVRDSVAACALAHEVDARGTPGAIHRGDGLEHLGERLAAEIAARDAQRERPQERISRDRGLGRLVEREAPQRLGRAGLDRHHPEIVYMDPTVSTTSYRRASSTLPPTMQTSPTIAPGPIDSPSGRP